MPLFSLHSDSLPVGDDAVAATLPVGGGRARAEQLVLAGVQRNEQVDHEAGVVDGLAEHGALFTLYEVQLLLLAKAGPRAQLLGRQVHSGALRSGGGLGRREVRILANPET